MTKFLDDQGYTEERENPDNIDCWEGYNQQEYSYTIGGTYAPTMTLKSAMIV